MRIIGYIDHPILKITIFQMENKLSVKLESGPIEQIYKFRTGGPVNTVDDIRKVVDDTFIAEVMQEMGRMRSIQVQALERLSPDEGEEGFKDII